MERELQHLARNFVMHGSMTSDDFAVEFCQIVMSYRKKTAQMLEIAAKYMSPAGGEDD